MKKNRTLLSFGLLISSIIAIMYLIGNIRQLKTDGYSEISLFTVIICSLLIIVNTSAFITTDRNNEAFQKVKWRSYIALALFSLLLIMIGVLYIVKGYEQKFIAAAVLIIAVMTFFLLIFGINSKTISEYEEEKMNKK